MSRIDIYCQCGLVSDFTFALLCYWLAVWSKVRDDKDKDFDWILIGYDGNSKTDMTVLDSGSGGMEAVSSKLPEGEPVFGGVRLSTGRFVHFLYVDESCPAMKRGRTLMYKNGKHKGGKIVP